MNAGALPAPGSPEAPKYWKDETGGELARAIENYLNNREISDRDVALMRAYFVQWAGSPVWDQNPHLTEAGREALRKLRAAAAEIRTEDAVIEWLDYSDDLGMDPL